MQDKVKRFIDNIGGNFVEISYRDAIYQCMDLLYAWVFVNDIPKATVQHQYAYEVWTKANSLTREYFDLLENTSSFVPIAGDIAVFKGGEAGHVAIVADNNNDVNGINLFEQNLPLGANPRIRRASYVNVLGFLRPKVQAVPQPEPIIEDDTVIPQIIDEKGNAMQVQAIRSTIKDTKAALKSCQDNTQARINEAVEKEQAEQLRSCSERLKNAENEAESKWKAILADKEEDCQLNIKNLKLEIETLMLQKVENFSAINLIKLGLKKLFSRR